MYGVLQDYFWFKFSLYEFHLSRSPTIVDTLICATPWNTIRSLFKLNDKIVKKIVHIFSVNNEFYYFSDKISFLSLDTHPLIHTHYY